MKKSLLLLTIAVLLLSGCTAARSIGNNESYVVDPEGNKYLVSLRKNAKVTFKHSDGSTIEVDNRGKESVIEGMVKLYGLSVIKTED